MNPSIVDHLDAEIAKLTAAREILAETATSVKQQEAPQEPSIHLIPKRTMSPEVRAKMSLAAKRRWEKRRRNKSEVSKAA